MITQPNADPATPPPPAPIAKPPLEIGEFLAAGVAASFAFYMLNTGTLEGWHFASAILLLVAGLAAIGRFLERVGRRLFR